MKAARVSSAVLFLGLLGSAVVGWAQDKGTWHAVSKTATAITGDLGLTPDKLYLNFMPYTVSSIRALTTTETSALFAAEGETNGVGNLYRLLIPGTKRFLHKNTLCGSEDVQWMATSVNGKTMQVALFSGSKMPQLTADWVANTTELCGTFMYSK